jgi:hypothetical protein
MKVGSGYMFYLYKNDDQGECNGFGNAFSCSTSLFYANKAGNLLHIEKQMKYFFGEES